MTTSSAVRTAWNSYIWEYSTVTTITDKIHAFDVLANIKSRTEISDLIYEQEINAFSYIVTRTAGAPEVTSGSTTATSFEFEVEVNYYRQKDISATDSNYNQVIDRLETIDGLVYSRLGSKWQSTVLYWNQAAIERPRLLSIDGKEVWAGRIRYTAVAVA